MHSSDREAPATAQVQEIRSILTRSGLTIKDLAQRAGYNIEYLQKVARGVYSLSPAKMGNLRYAALRDVGGLVQTSDAGPQVSLLDQELQDKLAAIVSRGGPSEIALLKRLVNVAYETLNESDADSSEKSTNPQGGRRSDKDWVSLSIFGTIPAGWPDDRSAAKPIRIIQVEAGKFPEGAFGLEVSGESMNKAVGKYGPILDGETVVLLPPEQREAQHGDIVAALCDGQTTLKRLDCKLRKMCVLRAESDAPEWKDCIRPAHDLVIQGVVVGKL